MNKTHVNFYFLFFLFLMFNLLKCAKLKSKTEVLSETKIMNQIESQNKFLVFYLQNRTYKNYTYANTYEKYFALGECNQTNCEEPYGSCMNNKVCACNDNYGHQLNQPANMTQMSCSIKLKQQSWFFFLEFITWIGGGHLYAERYSYAGLKAAFVMSVIIFSCIIAKCCKLKGSPNTEKFLNILTYFLYFLIIVLQTFDIVMIGLNKFKDGHGFQIRTLDGL